MINKPRIWPMAKVIFIAAPLLALAISLAPIPAIAAGSIRSQTVSSNVSQAAGASPSMNGSASRAVSP
ncbi:MAG: hypothetical protein ACREP6_00835, partial [Candidatus Binataceae bacterium]